MTPTNDDIPASQWTGWHFFGESEIQKTVLSFLIKVMKIESKSWIEIEVQVLYRIEKCPFYKAFNTTIYLTVLRIVLFTTLQIRTDLRKIWIIILEYFELCRIVVRGSTHVRVEWDIIISSLVIPQYKIALIIATHVSYIVIQMTYYYYLKGGAWCRCTTMRVILSDLFREEVQTDLSETLGHY